MYIGYTTNKNVTILLVMSLAFSRCHLERLAVNYGQQAYNFC